MYSIMPPQPEQRWFDRHTKWQPEGTPVVDTQGDDLVAPKAALCCARCLHPVTEHAAYLEMSGGHTHVFTNPGGITYELALYRYADCLIHGPATTDYTWFSGYAWQLALCINCHEHLGWRYRKPGNATFYGLIRERLREVNS